MVGKERLVLFQDPSKLNQTCDTAGIIVRARLLAADVVMGPDHNAWLICWSKLHDDIADLAFFNFILLKL